MDTYLLLCFSPLKEQNLSSNSHLCSHFYIFTNKMQWNKYIQQCQSNKWSAIASCFLEIEFNSLPYLEGTFTIWEETDSYLVGGMPLVDLVDLLNLTGEGLGSLGAI